MCSTQAFLLSKAYSEDLSYFSDDSFDVVVVTCVLCSISDVAKSLEEINRVLKPGGRFYFLDHIGAPKGSFKRKLQERMEEWWNRDRLQ